jgi:hypothetical protein
MRHGNAIGSDKNGSVFNLSAKEIAQESAAFQCQPAWRVRVRHNSAKACRDSE